MSRPPATRIEPVVEVLHGVPITDPYRWLEDARAPEVRAWAAAQNAYARSVLDALPGRPAVAARLEVAIDRGALSGSEPRGRYRLFTRRTSGMDQAALYVSEGGGPERLLFDPGPMSADATTALDWWTPSPDGELVCLGVSEAGSEESTLILLTTSDGELHSDRIPRCRWSAVGFEPGNGAILYSREPRPGAVPPGEEMYHRHVWRHALGADPAEDVEVFGQGRDKLDYPTGISFSKDGRWTVIVVAQGWDRTSVFLRRDSGAFEPIFEGHDKQLYAWFARNRLLGLTNLDAPNYRLVEIDPEHPQPAAWRELVPESGHVLAGATVTAGAIAVHHLVDACSRVTMLSHQGAPERELELPPYCSVTGLGGHPSSPELFVTVETFTTPAFTTAFPTGSDLAEVDRLPPPPGFEPRNYPVRRTRCRSRDGTEVPIFLVGRAAAVGPTVLTGYGGFNVSRTPLWMATAVPFLEAGGLVAIANLRGGGEFGEGWHRAGMLGRKQNVFDDFIAAAEWLLDAGLATSATLGIMGGSNGGLLVGAAMTQRPELFGCVVCRVPLLDMVRYEHLKVAELWTAEYGTVSDPQAFRWLYAYSPYHHVKDGVPYPPTLITAGEEDARDDPMHARKMAARLQGADPTGQFLLQLEPRAGHGQGKPVSKTVAEEADAWTFLLSRLRR